MILRMVCRNICFQANYTKAILKQRESLLLLNTLKYSQMEWLTGSVWV